MKSSTQQQNLRTRVSSMPLVVLVGIQLLGVQPLRAAPADHGLYAYRGLIRYSRLPVLTIPQGTDIPVKLDVNVTVKQDQIGRTFPAHISRDVMVDDAVAIPAEAPAEVALVESEDKPGAVAFRLVSVSVGGQMRRVRTNIARADETTSGLNTGKKTGIGAAAGGALGLILGGGSGLLKGAVVGAGGGLAWGLLDKGNHQVQHDTPLLFSLSAPVRVR